KGYRRFAYAGSLDGNDLRAGKRLNGFRQTIQAAGATMLSETISAQPSSMVEGRRITAEILSKPDLPDAIYYSNDDLAAGGIMHCLSEGIPIPTKVAMAGFNGLPFLDALPIQLTTIATPRYEIGRLAGEFLANLNDESAEQPSGSIDLGFHLIPGETC
ncbi:MAG: substrate-binding domain-containing protein, partial [Sneathiella sp.]